MAGENLDLKIVIDTLLNSKGFEEAQAGLKALSGATNTTAAATDTATGKQKGLARELGGTRGPAADLTRILLQQIGVTGAAGEAAKAAGSAFNVMGGAATMMTLGLTAGVAVLALIIPKIMEWIRHTREQTEEQKQIVKEINDAIPNLEEYAKGIDTMSAALQALIALQREEAGLKQSKDIEDLVSMQHRLTARINELQSAGERLVITNARSGESHKVGAAAVEKHRQEIDKLTSEYRHNEIVLNASIEARVHGTTIEREAAAALKRAEEAERKARAAAEARAKATKDYAAWQKQFSKQQEIDARKDMTTTAVSSKATNKQIQDVTAEKLKAKGQRIAAIKEESDADRQAALDKRATDASLLASGTQVLSTMWGENKGVRIAQAIADTYAAATRALAEGGPYAGPILAGIMVAQGLANVAKIQQTQPGFDDPFSDMLASKLGRKSAADFVQHFGAGFQQGMGGGGGSTVHQTTINRGTTMNVTANGIIGSRTAFRSWLEREMTLATRVRARKTI